MNEEQALEVMASFRVVLVGTLYGGNVGSVCRAMANCGISKLRLAAPDPDLTWEEARKMAVHATDILDKREIYPDMRSAVADCVAVVGTTRRGGLYRAHCRDSLDLAPDLLEIAKSGPVALVFGREDKGLFNDELLLCTHISCIAAAPAYQSLNLSQSVMVVCHEIYRRALEFIPTREKGDLATSDMRQRLMDGWREYLLQIGFMKEDKAEHMMEGFERIFTRGALTEQDVRILMGVMRQSQWKIKSLTK